MSKYVILLRIRVTSAAISGATFCLTVMAIFLVLDHFSGNSYKRKIKLYKAHVAWFNTAKGYLQITALL
jgi:hypothetical protein